MYKYFCKGFHLATDAIPDIIGIAGYTDDAIAIAAL